jgi:hypothetical protein
MGYRETILQAVRAWHVATTGLASDHVIPADDKGAKPSLPYLTVRVGPVATIGRDEWRENAAGRVIVGQRRATVTVQAYGLASDDIEDLLEFPTMALADRTVYEDLDDAGLTIVETPPTQTIPALLDTAIEARAARAYVVVFRLAGTPVDAVEFAEAVVDITYIDTDPDATPLVDTITVS